MRVGQYPVESWWLSEEVDVLAPCALGAILNSQSILTIRARVIAGAANNQLAEERDGAALQLAGVLYAPDYVVNAGGIISVAREYNGGASEAQVTNEIHGIPGRLTEIFERARRGRPRHPWGRQSKWRQSEFAARGRARDWSPDRLQRNVRAGR